MTNLLPHQTKDSEALLSQDHGLNFSTPGTGKTLTDLAVFAKGGFTRGVIIAPSIALTMWAEEITNYLGMSAEILRTGKSPIVGEPDFVVTTYALACDAQFERIAGFLGSTDGGTKITLDESHYLKTRTSKRTVGIFGPSCNGKHGLFGMADRVDQLTGTPITRYPDDLWAQLRAPKAQVLREWGVESYEQFVEKFCRTAVKQFHPRQRPQRVVVGAQNMSALQKMLFEDCKAVRRTMDDVAYSMPPLTTRTLEVALTPNAELTQLVKGLSEERIIQLLSEDSEEMAKAWKLLGLAKVEDMAEYIADSALQGPVLTGYWHRDVGSALRANLEKRKLTVREVNGSTHSDQRDAIRTAFNKGDVDVLLGQISAMNTSWNIQEASAHVIMAEDHFSPGMVEQFYKRVYRMGQKQHVQLDFLKSSNPLDKAITRNRTTKVEINKAILDD